MAEFTDLGMLMPSKSAYQNPGEYESTQRNIALQKATYQSEMDKTYAGIDEMAREFDITNELNVTEFLEGVRQFDVSAELQQQELGLQAASLDIEADKVSSYSDALDHDKTFDWIGLGIETFKSGGLWDDVSSWF